MAATAPSLGWKTWVATAVGYVAAVAYATDPLLRQAGSRLPWLLMDVQQHLWILRWYRTCLLEGRWPLLCNEILYPVGAPLGNFSPLQLQGLIFVPLSLLLRNDVLSYNLLWLLGMLTTGLGTFLLVWQVVRSRPCAVFGGLTAMLSAPVVLHAQGHLELIYVGTIPLFLAAWLRFVDAPSRSRLMVSVGLYLLVALSAAYFAVFAAIPAAWYVACAGLGAARRRDGAWLRSRVAWLAAFAGLALPLLLLSFAGAIWSMTQGYAGDRSLDAFVQLGGTGLWAYATPTVQHRLASLLPFDVYTQAAPKFGSTMEMGSYLGLVPLTLISIAAASSVRLPRAWFWWSLLGLLAILSCGAYWQLGSWRIPLPALWLREYAFGFQMIRSPERFNLLVAVTAALLAAFGLRLLLGRVRSRLARGTIFAAVAALTVVDLAPVAFVTDTLPPLPACYAAIRQLDPEATLLELPQYHSGGAPVSSTLTYWQSIHRLRTSAGYQGLSNKPYDNLVAWNSPFLHQRMEQPSYLRDPGNFLQAPQGPPPPLFGLDDLVHEVGPYRYSFTDCVWMHASVFGYDYIVLHQWDDSVRAFPGLPRLKEQLAHARVYEDDRTIVYQRQRLQPPGNPVVLPLDGWRAAYRERAIRVAEARARLAVYNPDPEQPLRLTLDAGALNRPRTVRVLSGATEVARFQVSPSTPPQTHTTPPFRLPAGLQVLTLDSDGQEVPLDDAQLAFAGDHEPYSLRVDAVALGSVPPEDTPPQVLAVGGDTFDPATIRRR